MFMVCTMNDDDTVLPNGELLLNSIRIRREREKNSTENCQRQIKRNHIIISDAIYLNYLQFLAFSHSVSLVFFSLEKIDQPAAIVLFYLRHHIILFHSQNCPL